jgi:hypothetical protein
MQAVPLQQVQGLVGNYLPLSGGQLSGNLTAPSLTGQGSYTGSLTTDGAVLYGNTQSAVTASQIAIWAYGPQPTNEMGFDAVRGVAVQQPGTTLPLVNGVAGYVVTRQAITPGLSAPTGCALWGMGVADVAGASVWGIGTLLTDNSGQTVSSGGGRNLYNELDFNFTNPNSTGIGLSLGGTSLVQPTIAAGIILMHLDANQGQTAKWSSFLSSYDGATNSFLVAGARAATGSNVQSQDFTMAYRDAGGTRGIITYAAQPDGSLLFAKTGGGLVTLNAVSIPGYLPLSGGTVTGPAAFAGSGVAVDATAGDIRCGGAFQAHYGGGVDLIGATTVFGNLVITGNISGNTPNLYAGSHLVPQVSNFLNCGNAIGNEWLNVCSRNFITVTSSRAYKKDIERPSEDALQRVLRLKPCDFHWHEETSTAPLHRGFIAEDVGEVMGERFAGWVRERPGREGIVYNELLPVLWQAVQELAREVGRLRDLCSAE